MCCVKCLYVRKNKDWFTIKIVMLDFYHKFLGQVKLHCLLHHSIVQE